MIAAVDAYLAVRRLGGFALSNTEYLLRSFAAYAGAHGEGVIRTATVITWATQGPSLAQRHRRYETVRQFAAQLHLDDPRHEVPPARYFGYRKTRRPPRLYTETEIDQLLAVVAQLRPVDALTPHTYVALLSLLAATGLRISEALARHVRPDSGVACVVFLHAPQRGRRVVRRSHKRRQLREARDHWYGIVGPVNAFVFFADTFDIGQFA